MADVTISQLSQITPNNGALLPISQGGVTYSVAPSALLINSGNVGIGTSTPNYKLVVSEGGAQGFEVQTSTSSRIDLLTYNRATSLYTDAQINSKNFIVRTGAGPSVAENLRVDTTGAVTKPSQPAFAVQADNNSYVHPANSLVRILAFTGKIFDVGNNFNTSLSRFTAPVGGVYSFSGMLRTNPSPNGWLYPSFFVNGVQYANGSLPGLSWNQNPNSSGFGTSNFHTLIKLNAGDYVDYYFGVGSAGTYQIDGQSIWYGYLLG